jgi:hypothetical protein
MTAQTSSEVSSRTYCSSYGSGRAPAPDIGSGHGRRGTRAPDPPPRPGYTRSPVSGSGTASRAAHRRQLAEAVALLVVGEFQLDDDAPTVLVPLPPQCAVGDRSLSEVVTVGTPPAARRDIPVEDLDGQPVVHATERTPESDIPPCAHTPSPAPRWDIRPRGACARRRRAVRVLWQSSPRRRPSVVASPQEGAPVVVHPERFVNHRSRWAGEDRTHDLRTTSLQFTRLTSVDTLSSPPTTGFRG